MGRKPFKFVVTALLVCALSMAALTGCAGTDETAVSVVPDAIILENGYAIATDVEFFPGMPARIVLVILEVTLTNGDISVAEIDTMQTPVLLAEDGEQYHLAGYNLELEDPLVGAGFLVPSDVDAYMLTFVSGDYSAKLQDLMS